MNHYNYNMKGKLENGSLEIRPVIVVAQVRGEGNWKIILLIVMDWSVNIGGTFLNARINKT